MGGASNFVDLWENGAGFRGSDDQRKMTPFQRQVISAAREKEAERKEELRNQQQQGGAGADGPDRTRNARASGSSGADSDNLGQEETVRYINEQKGDHDYDYQFVDAE